MKVKFYMLLTVLLSTFASAAMADGTVHNATNGKDYETLDAALKDLDATADENVLELNGDVTLDARRGPAEGKTLTIKPTKDGITIHRGKLDTKTIWLLTNKGSQTLNLGCDEHQLIIDGESSTYTKEVLGCEQGKMNVTNVKFTNFKYGNNARLNNIKSGNLTLKNVIVENCQTECQFFVCPSNDKLALDGSLNFDNCTGNHISVKARIVLKNVTSFTASTPITLDMAEALQKAGTLVVKGDNTKVANPAAPYFVDASNQYSIIQNPTAGHKYELILAETTGIDNITTTTQSKDAEYYDLQGRRVMNPTKGIYIVNNKKVIIK